MGASWPVRPASMEILRRWALALYLMAIVTQKRHCRCTVNGVNRKRLPKVGLLRFGEQ
jgi:hypothetical protein